MIKNSQTPEKPRFIARDITNFLGKMLNHLLHIRENIREVLIL